MRPIQCPMGFASQRSMKRGIWVKLRKAHEEHIASVLPRLTAEMDRGHGGSSPSKRWMVPRRRSRLDGRPQPRAVGSEGRRVAGVGSQLRILEGRSNLMRSGLTSRDHRDARVGENSNERFQRDGHEDLVEYYA